MKTNMMPAILSIRSAGILPVICIKNDSELKTFLLSLENTPIRCVEITLRHEYALKAISMIKTSCPEIVVGAGTVVTESLFTKAVQAGADFCVSPGTDFSLLKLAKSHNIPFIPGCMTPSEIQNAENEGLSLVKFFPAECAGGPAALKLYEGAFPGITFIPTGGITKDNLPSYLKCQNVLACGGSFMIPKDQLAAGDDTSIRNGILQLCALRGGNADI